MTSPNSAQTSVSPGVTTTFTLTVTDSVGATSSDAVVVTVAAPVANAGGNDVSVDPGSSLQIGTTAKDGTTYAWTCDRPTCALSSTSAAQPTAKPTLSTKYTVTATSPEGCSATDSTTVWVNLPVSTTPADGASYPANRPLVVQFGAAVLPSSLSLDTIKLREADSDTALTFEFAYNATSRILSITPKGMNGWSAGDRTLTLVGGAAGILSDDAIRPQRLPGDVVVRFSLSNSADNTRPTIVTRIPSSGTTGVPTNTSVSAVWSEPLNPTTVNSFSLFTGMNPVAGTVTYDAKTNTVTFVPNTALAPRTTYAVWAFGIQDPSGNPATFTPWNFTTGD